MGNASGRPVLPDSRALFSSDLPKFVIQTKFGKNGMLGDGKFMKSYLMRVDGTNVMVKVYMKLSDEDLNTIQKRLHQIWILLSPNKYPNLLPYQMWIRSQTAYARQKVSMTPIYLIRQYMASNLHDRLLTRPFLTDIEKSWLIFQLFQCLEIAHSQDVIHGDIKPENVLCTGWNFLVLTDFSPYKPTNIPSDDPTDFKYFFDSSGRRSCCVAPERFVPREQLGSTSHNNNDIGDYGDNSDHDGGGDDRHSGLTFAMDVFSLGCTIAEVHLDSSTALFDLPSMLSYVVNKDNAKGIDDLDGQVKSVLSRIDSQPLRDVIVHMTQKDPRKRLRVDEYKCALQGKKEAVSRLSIATTTTTTLDQWTTAPLFPPYFEKMLLPIFFRMHYEGITPDRRIHILCESYRDLVMHISGIEDDERHEALQKILESTYDAWELQSRRKKAESIYADRSCGEATKKDATYQDQVKRNRERYIESAFLLSSSTAEMDSAEPTNDRQSLAGDEALTSRCNNFMKSIDIAFTATSEKKKNNSTKSDDCGDDGAPYQDFYQRSSSEHPGPQRTYPGFVILVQLVASNLRHLQSPQCKIVSILLLLRFSSLSEDEVILRRILPSLLNSIEDAQNGHVSSVAIRAVASVLSLVNKITLVDEEVFPTYIAPAINRVLRVNDNLVRTTFAATIGLLAETGKRFLERAHFDAQQKAMNGSQDTRLGKDTASSPPSQYQLPSPPSSPATESSMPRGNDEPTLVDFQYTKRLQDLRETIAHWVKVVLSDLPLQGEMRKGSGLSSAGTLIKRELLRDIERLCIFFGEDMVISVLLPHLLTFFSDHDWELRLTFWKQISTVCAFVGATLTQAYVLPGIDHGLVDCEECVVIETVRCLDSLCKMRLLAVPALMSCVDASKASALLLHPSEPIREATMILLSSVSQVLGPVDTVAFLVPAIEKFFHNGLTLGAGDNGILSPDVIRSAVRKPLDQATFRKGVMSRHQALLEKRPMPSEPTSLNSGNGSDDVNSQVPTESPQPAEEKTRDDDDSVAMSLMTPYIEHAAIELHTKISQWRYALHGSLYTSPYAAALRRCTSTISNFSSAGTLDALMNLSANAQFSTQSLNTLMVPHQKYGLGFYYPLTEEQRYMCAKIGEIRDPDAICALYGMGSSRYEAEKVLTWANKDSLASLADENSRTSDVRTITKENADAANAVDRTESTEKEVVTDFDHRPDITSNANGRRSSLLKKRIRALGIPPLPPDVGSLLQPQLTEDKRLQVYNGYIESLTLNTGNGGAAGAAQGVGTGAGAGAIGAAGGIGPSMSFTGVESVLGESITSGGARDATSNGRGPWRPKEGVLVCTLREHTRAANRVAVCPDQSFFGSASSDGTVKIWQLRGMDTNANPRSSLTYKRHHSPVTDITVVENSHSMASCSADGTIHVWRVDVDGKVQLSSTSYADEAGPGGEMARSPGLGVVGMGLLKVVSPNEGAVEAVQHFNGDVASVLAYVTRDGGVHGWDLRSSRDAFYFDVRPELGSSTAMTVAPDRSWIIVGTSRGFILLWDLRYNVLCKLWRHSSGGPIHRLACCKSLQQAINSTQYPTSSPALADTEGSYLYVAAGHSEMAIFGLPEAGECLKCFRSIPLSKSREPIAGLPSLEEVSLPRSPDAFITSAFDSTRGAPTNGEYLRELGVKAMVGKNPSYLITAGSDSMIRYWDFSSPAKCFTISGLMPGQPRSIYEAPTDEGMLGRMFLSFDSVIPSADTTLPQHLPLRAGRGPIVPSNAFKDAVLDLKTVNLPTQSIISSAKDGTIKLWR